MSDAAKSSEAEKFRDAMKKILSVPKAEVLRREAEEKKRGKERKKDGD